MSSTMQAWRTDVSTLKTNFLETMKTLLAEVFDGWLSETDIVDDTTSVDYKLSTDLWLRVNSSGIYCHNNIANTDLSLFTLGNYSTYLNVTVLKSDHCLIFCINSGTTALSQYTLQANFVIDSIDNEDGYAFVNNWSTGATDIIDTETKTQSSVYIAYNTKSYNANTSSLQVAPLVNNSNGTKLDNLQNVLITPVNTAGFVAFNNQKWWINNGYFAVPAGDDEPEYTLVS